MTFAQVMNPDAAEKIGEKIADGVAKGLEQTSVVAPTNWILMVAAIVLAALGFGALCWLVPKILATIKELQAAQDNRDAEHRQHVRELSSEFNTRSRESAAECHTHSKEVVALGKESAAILSSAASDIKHGIESVQTIVHDNRALVHDARGILQQQKGLIDLALMRLGHPTINQLITTNPPGAEEIEGKEEGEA